MLINRTERKSTSFLFIFGALSFDPNPSSIIICSKTVTETRFLLLHYVGKGWHIQLQFIRLTLFDKYTVDNIIKHLCFIYKCLSKRSNPKVTLKSTCDYLQMPM
jgi:hypothetical protein